MGWFPGKKGEGGGKGRQAIRATGGFGADEETEKELDRKGRPGVELREKNRTQ